MNYASISDFRLTIGYLNLSDVKKMTDTTSLPEDQKIFSTKELKNKGFSQYKVSKLVREGKLIKLNKSYYENETIMERNPTSIMWKLMHRKV